MRHLDILNLEMFVTTFSTQLNLPIESEIVLSGQLMRSLL